MATTQKYLGHLLQNADITPACSEEERLAAEDLASIFSAHGFEPEVQEFNASPTPRVVRAVLAVVVFVGSVIMGIGGAIGIIGAIVAIAMAVLYLLDRMGKITLPGAGGTGVSQNVIAYHQASGPLASPRNRPVVVVAHYDSPRADLFARLPLATYRPIIAKLLPYAMVAPAIIAIVRLLPFPAAAKAVLWVIAILIALIPLAYAVGVIANRLVLPYTSGSVCNKSSVAALLGVMDAVAPYAGENEFPDDVPFDEYFSELTRQAEEEELAAAIAAGDLPEDASAEDELSAEGELAEDVDDDVSLQGTASMSAEDVAQAAVDLGATAAISNSALMSVTAIAEAAAEHTAGQGDVDAEDDAEAEAVAAEDAKEIVEPEEPGVVNEYGNYRFGEDVIRSIGMVPESCTIVYVDDEPAADEEQDEGIREDAPVTDGESFQGEEAQVSSSDDELPFAEEDVRDEYEYEDDQDAFEQEVQPGIAGALSAVGAGAARLFGGVKRRGKGVLGSLTNHVVDAEPFEEAFDESAVEETPDVEGALDTNEGVSEGEVQPLETVDASAAADVETAPVVDVDDEPSDETPAAEQAATVDSTRAFDASTGVAQEERVAEPEPVNLGATIAQGTPIQPTEPAARPVETVDSLMAEISVPVVPTVQRASQRTFRTVPDPSTPSINQVNTSSRASLFDLPDPSSEPVDPFASVSTSPTVSAVQDASVPVPAPEAPQPAPSGFSVIGPNDIVEPVQAEVPAFNDGVFETISADAPIAASPVTGEKKRGLGKLFGRKKRQEESMSDWLGVDTDFDAKRSGRDIGSWDNFEGDDWKGGATGAEGVSVDELRDAVTSMGDDELLGHDIWFVATGASEFDHAGIDAFLDEHRDKLRGVFLINLESIGAGEPCMLATEGDKRVLKGDMRIMKLVSRVSGALHEEFGKVEMPYLTTDAYRAMERSLRSLTIAGVEEGRLACSHTEDDLPYRVKVKNVNMVADVVTEVIRRS